MNRISTGVSITVSLVMFLLLTFGVNAETTEICEKIFPDWAVQVGLSFSKDQIYLPTKFDTLSARIESGTKVLFSSGKNLEEKILTIEAPDFKSTLAFNLKNWTVEVLNITTGVLKPDYNELELESFSEKIQRAINQKVVGTEKREDFLPLGFKEDQEEIIIKTEEGEEIINKKDYPQFSFELVEGKFLIVSDKVRKLLYSGDGGRWQFGILYLQKYKNFLSWNGMLFGPMRYCTASGKTITGCLEEFIKAAWNHDIKDCPDSFFSIGDKTLIGQGPTLDGWYQIKSETKYSSLWVNPQKWTEKYGLPTKIGRGWDRTAVISTEYYGTYAVIDDKEYWRITLLWDSPQAGYRVTNKL